MKARISILIVVICLSLSSCALLFSPYITTLDDFKNTKKSIFEITLMPAEYMQLSPVQNANIIFERITSATGETSNVYFVISRSTTSFNMEPKCYVRADGKSYELEIESEGTEFKTKHETSSTTTTVKDSVRVKTESTSKSNNYDWYEDKLIVRLTPEIKNSLLNTKELSFRFYFGPKEATFKFKGYSLKKVKGLFEI
ncbi:MAG: hypothetical protein PHT07_02950 [Paludibacter sp.]|nr:hypothetical protein [Paludibacter sp.]